MSGELVCVNKVTIYGNKYAFVIEGEKPFYVDYEDLHSVNPPALYKSFFEQYKKISSVSYYSDNSPSEWAGQFANIEVKHPVSGKVTTLYNVIINLNDYHQWTREQIADWLETTDANPVITKSDTSTTEEY
jgi:hypothetical protein